MTTNEMQRLTRINMAVIAVAVIVTAINLAHIFGAF